MIGPKKSMPAGPPSDAKAPRRASLPSLRLLPVMIFVAVLMLTVRVNDVWRGMSGAVSINQSEAQQPTPPGGRKPGQRTPAQPEVPPAGPGVTQNPAASMPAPPEEPSASDGEPPTFTQNEIDVLQKLSVRRETLDNRQKDLDARENLVKAAEARIDKKIAEMKALQTNIEGMLKQVDQQDENKLKSLVKIYEQMKPKNAADILSTLEMQIQIGVLTRMKEAKVAPILAAMDVTKAQAVTDAMAARRAAKAEGQLN